VKTKKAFIYSVNPLSIRAGEYAEIIGVVWGYPEGLPARLCYRVRYPDGCDDFISMLDNVNFAIDTGPPT